MRTTHRDDSARPLRVRSADSLAGTVVMTEYLANVPWPGMDATIAALVAQDCTVRITGSSALALLQVGFGAAVGCIIGRYAAIDNAASILIGTEAGAVVSGVDGLPDEAPPGGVLLASPAVHGLVLNAWRAAVASRDLTALPASALIMALGSDVPPRPGSNPDRTSRL